MLSDIALVNVENLNMETEPLVAVKGVNLAIRDRQILHDVSLRLEDGEILTLIGPNGAGKTMLVRIILGLAQPDTGRVRLRSGARIGYMPQRLTVEETLPLTVHRFITLGTPARKERVKEILEETGAVHVVDSPIQAISGGEMQRIMLARALLRNPEFLVLDEPVQGVDVTGQQELYELIGRIRQRRGCGILMVSHDLHLVMSATDRVICLNHHVCCSGHPDKVSRDPAYLQLFGDKGLRSIALYQHRHDHHHDLRGDMVASAPENSRVE